MMGFVVVIDIVANDLSDDRYGKPAESYLQQQVESNGHIYLGYERMADSPNGKSAFKAIYN